MDWKEELAKLASQGQGNSEHPESHELSENQESAGRGMPRTENASPYTMQKGALHVVVEKKGRGGKTATIVEGFEISDEDVAEIARELKKKLGAGGSSRGGEILIQGERKAEVISFLKQKGMKVKG